MNLIGVYKARTAIGVRDTMTFAKRYEIKVRLVSFDKSLRRQMVSLQLIQKSFCRKSLHFIILENDLTRLDNVNLYISDQIMVAELLKSRLFNVKQRDEVELLHKLSDGGDIFQGSSGACKTFWLNHAIRPLIIYFKEDGSRHMILLTASENDAASDTIYQQSKPPIAHDPIPVFF